MLQPIGKGPLAVVHKATIAIAVPGLAVYAVWEGRRWMAGGDVGAAVGCVAALAATLLAAGYLRALLRQG